jgi:hypothetical protein
VYTATTDQGVGDHPQSVADVLGDPVVVLVGATGQGKTTSLNYLATQAAAAGLIPIRFSASGHTAGALDRRVRNVAEDALSQQLAPGALAALLAAPGLLLLIDGISEVDEQTRAALRADLQHLATQRPLRVVATARDLPKAVSVVDAVAAPKAYRLTPLNRVMRREIAGRLPGLHPNLVDHIEDRLGDAVDNPMLFVMALSVAGDGVPESRAAVYEQFLRGLVARSGIADADDVLTALGLAWAAMIGRDQRAADRYTWLTALAVASEGPGALGPGGNDPRAMLSIAEAVGLLVRLDPDGGLAPVHDSFADFLAGRCIARGQAAVPDPIAGQYDEAMLFMADIGGLDHRVAVRVAADNPLLACRLAKLPAVAGRTDVTEVGELVAALAGGCNLPLLGSGISMLHHQDFTGVVLTQDGLCQLVDQDAFDGLTRDRPAVMVRPEVGTIALATRLWATAVVHAQRPRIRVMQMPPPLDAAIAAEQLAGYVADVERELVRLAETTLPPCLRSRVLQTLGPRGLVAIVDGPRPGLFGNVELEMRYRRAHNTTVVAGDDRGAAAELAGSTTVERFMSRHPTIEAVHLIGAAVNVLSRHTWPVR